MADKWRIIEGCHPSKMPTLRIKDRINLAQRHLQSQVTETVTADLVPIYSDLSFSEDLAPAQKVKGHLDKAKEALKSGNKQVASNELKAADESVSYSEVDLPLNETQKLGKSALIALNQNQSKKADQDLAKIENNLRVNFSEIIATPVNQKAGSAAKDGTS